MGWVEYIFKSDSTLLLGYGGEQWQSKYKKVGMWWEDSIGLYLNEGNGSIMTYIKDSLVVSLVLIPEKELEYWYRFKPKIQDSIQSRIKKDEWWIDTLSENEQKEIIQEVEYDVGLNLLCGREIMVGGYFEIQK